MWTTEYILSQVCVIIATILYGLSYCTKNKKVILILNMLSIIFYVAEYSLLHSFMAAAMKLVALCRIIWFYINDRLGKKNDYTSLIVSMSVFVIMSILTYSHPMDLLSLVASLVFTYAVWQNDIFWYRALSVMTGILWVMLDIYYYTLMGIILGTVLFIVKLVSTIKFVIDNHKTIDRQK